MCRVLCVLVLALFATQASAVATFEFTQDGDDVVGTLSGTLNVSGLTPTPTTFMGCDNCSFYSGGAVILGSNTSSQSFDRYSILGPARFWTAPFTSSTVTVTSTSSSYTGTPFGLWGQPNRLYLPSGYDGSALSGELRLSGHSFESLSVKPGSYAYEIAFNGQILDSFTVVFDDSLSASIPLPAGAVLLLSALGALALRRRSASRAAA